MIDRKKIEKIVDRARIEEVVADFCQLYKQGTAYAALCPFHDDRRLGSFMISPQKNIYTCFSCGAHGGPVDFVMRRLSISYPDAIRYLGKKYGIDVEGADTLTIKPCEQTMQRPVQMPMLVLPMSMVEKKLSTDNTLCAWMRSLPWSPSQRARLDKMLRNYLVGTSDKGQVIYWQVDERGQVRTGKMMLYKADGHRDKTARHSFSWVHSRLAAAGWYDSEAYEMRSCLYGLHLLNMPGCEDATINIVESEKTAILCAIAYGNMANHLWMATGGMQNLTREKLLPLIEQGRHIILYPDIDGIDKWKDRCAQIGYDRMMVNEDMMRRIHTDEDGSKADLADILVRMMSQDTRKAEQVTSSDLDTLIARNPVLRMLIEKIDLHEIKIYGNTQQ